LHPVGPAVPARRLVHHQEHIEPDQPAAGPRAVNAGPGSAWRESHGIDQAPKGPLEHISISLYVSRSPAPSRAPQEPSLSRSSFLFTSESVSEGHPDKVADRISDTVVD